VSLLCLHFRSLPSLSFTQYNNNIKDKMLLGANLLGHHDPIMSYSTSTTPMASPHGVIGEHVQPQQQPQPQVQHTKSYTPDLSNLSIRARDDISVTHSQRDRERANDIFQRGPFDPFSRWSNHNNDPTIRDDGWDRASANHFASRPQSPRKGQNQMFDTPSEPPKSALPTFPSFTPIITPPAPQSLLLPPHSNSPSPPKGDRGREIVAQASQHLSSLQALIGPLLSKADELERLKQDLVLWKASSEAANMELLSLKAKASLASRSPVRPASLAINTADSKEQGQGQAFNAIIIDGDTQIVGHAPEQANRSFTNHSSKQVLKEVKQPPRL
jgi:hypothetical protein